MKNAVTIAHRFREVILNGTWIANTNMKHQLENLDWKIANKKIENLNTIADLTQHVHYYIAGINQVFGGGKLDIKDEFSFNFPVINSQEEWLAILQKFWTDAERFANYVESFSEDKLMEIFVDAKYGNYSRNIEAMIEHSYYHLGQIVLIRKLVENRQS